MLDGTTNDAGADAAQATETRPNEGAGAPPEGQLGGGAGAPEGEPKAEGEGKPEGDDKPAVTKQPWAHKRIDDLTAQRYEQQRRADAAERERDDLRQRIAAFERSQNGDVGQQQGERQPPQQTDADRAAAVRAEAAKLVETQRFNDSCNKVFEDGTKAYPDFADALGNFRLVGGLPPALIEAAIESDNAVAVLYQLGKDPDEAQRILGLSPTRMAVAVAKLAAKPPAAAPVSRTPAPIKPLAGGARSDPDPDKMSTAEWMAARRDGKVK